MLQLPDAWVWDFWFAEADGVHHVFYLQASRALHDPDRRHLRASVGHATSTDLRTWTRLPDALVHGDAPAVDDTATWTGSVIRGADGRWHLFYTGLSRRPDGGHLQQVTVATSDDLVSWRRTDAPVAAADPRWYRHPAAGRPPGGEEHWRDPWVFADPDGDGWHMLITAAGCDGPDGDSGVIGHARSADLASWQVGPPLSRPGSGFGQLEVPQVEVVEGRPVLLFSCLRGELGPGRRARGATGGTWAVACGSPTGPFDVEAATPLTDDTLYSGRLVRDHDGRWVLLAFRNRGPDGGFVGELTDPMPVSWDLSGERPRLLITDRPPG